jgi:P27 family predicted phage terminase small subunit
MARTGRRPLPTNVVRMRGNRSQLTEAELEERERSEVKPHPVAPRRPAGLSSDARACWDALAPELDRLGLLTVVDGQSFALACESYALAVQALREMRPRKADGTLDGRRKGREVVVPDMNHGGMKRHPAFVAYKQAVDDYRAWCREFGLTPSARVGLRSGAPIGSVPDDDEDDSAFFGS